jgi:membrane dipeptidase
VLRELYGMGARYMTLTHGKTTPWADSATDAPQHDGMTDFGQQVVREMNRIGMIVDLSHVSEATMKDALETTKAPVMFSHSGVRAVNDHPRNVPDSVLPAVKANGGVVMVVLLRRLRRPRCRAYGLARTAQKARLDALYVGNPAAAEAALKAWETANPPRKRRSKRSRRTISTISRATIGVDHIGLGGDYDGMDATPVGLEDVSGYPAVVRRTGAARLYAGRAREDFERQYAARAEGGRGLCGEPEGPAADRDAGREIAVVG